MRALHSHGSSVSTDLRHPQKSELRRRNPHSLTQPRPASRPDVTHAHTEHYQRPLSSYQPGCPLARSVGRAVGPPGLSRARLSVRANLGSQHPAPILKHIRHDSSGASLASTSSQHQTGRSMQTELSQEAGPQPAPTHYTHTHIHTFTHKQMAALPAKPGRGWHQLSRTTISTSLSGVRSYWEDSAPRGGTSNGGAVRPSV